MVKSWKEKNIGFQSRWTSEITFAVPLILFIVSVSHLNRLGLIGRVFMSGFFGRLANGRRKSHENSCFPARLKWANQPIWVEF